MRQFRHSEVDVFMPEVEEILAAQPVYVAGGAARWLVMAPNVAEPGDIDLFLYEAKDYRRTAVGLVQMGYRQEGETDSAATFEGPGLPIQLIKPVKTETTLTYGQPRDVLGHFSFTTEMFAVCQGGRAVVAEGAEEHTNDLVLVVNNITDPVQVAMRAVKYAAKGYAIAPEEMLKLFLDWTARPLEYRREVRRGFREALLV